MARPTYLVVDPGLLRKPQLPQHQDVVQYLGESDDNLVVLSDFALGEAFNGANQERIKRTFGLFQNRLHRVVVVHETSTISRMWPDGVAQADLVNELESNRFRALLHRVFTCASGVEQEIAKRADHERRRFDSLMLAASGIREDMLHVVSQIPDAEGSALRKGIITPVVSGVIARLVKDFTLDLMKHHVAWDKIPSPQQIVRTFVYRLALGLVVQGIQWKANGGLQSAADKRLRNDTTDATYVAYASLFGRFVSADGGARDLYSTVSSVAEPL